MVTRRGPSRRLANGHTHREGSLRFAYSKAGKRSITLDITKEAGRKLFLDLVERPDIILETFEPGYLTRCWADFASRAVLY